MIGDIIAGYELENVLVVKKWKCLCMDFFVGPENRYMGMEAVSWHIAGPFRIWDRLKEFTAPFVDAQLRAGSPKADNKSFREFFMEG